MQSKQLARYILLICRCINIKISQMRQKIAGLGLFYRQKGGNHGSGTVI